jgi:hypothetical protein
LSGFLQQAPGYCMCPHSVCSCRAACLRHISAHFPRGFHFPQKSLQRPPGSYSICSFLLPTCSILSRLPSHTVSATLATPWNTASTHLPQCLCCLPWPLSHPHDSLLLRSTLRVTFWWIFSWSPYFKVETLSLSSPLHCFILLVLVVIEKVYIFLIYLGMSLHYKLHEAQIIHT